MLVRLRVARRERAGFRVGAVRSTDERSERLAFWRPYFRADQGVLLRRGLALRCCAACDRAPGAGADILRRQIDPTRRCSASCALR